MTAVVITLKINLNYFVQIKQFQRWLWYN